MNQCVNKTLNIITKYRIKRHSNNNTRLLDDNIFNGVHHLGYIPRKRLLGSWSKSISEVKHTLYKSLSASTEWSTKSIFCSTHCKEQWPSTNLADYRRKWFWQTCQLYHKDRQRSSLTFTRHLAIFVWISFISS